MAMPDVELMMLRLESLRNLYPSPTCNIASLTEVNGLRS